MTAAVAPSGIEFEAPSGWWCLDLNGPALPPRLAELLRDIRDSGRSVAAGADDHALAYVTWLHDQGASIALLRPGDDRVPPAICGGVFVEDALPVAGEELYELLDADGESVALGDLGGVPIISHVARWEGDVPTVRITYLLCAPRTCMVITFAAPEVSGVKRVVDEVARVVSAVRVVHSES